MAMKKNLSLKGLLMALCILVSSAAFSQVMVPKAGLAYTNASTISDEGFGAMFGFVFSQNKVQLSSDFNYYFDEVGENEFSPFALNLDIRYVAFNYKKKFELFPIVGVNYSSIFTNEVGLNTGVGSTLEVSKFLKVFSEYKYVFGNMDGSTFSVGVQFQYPSY